MSARARGRLQVSGAKNAALKAMAATILFDGPVELHNVPHNADVDTMMQVLRKLGATVTVDTARPSQMIIDTTHIASTSIDASLATAMRSSVVLTGPLLARFGKVTFPAPGGCVIGARPIDLFIHGYEHMGATTTETNEAYDIATAAGKKLQGSRIRFAKISVGATETLMMAATLAHGTTILENCAIEPEIGNVAEWLCRAGARIDGIGTSTLTIIGRAGKLLSSAKVATEPHVTIPDRIEAGSFIILGALCGDEVVVENCEPAHVASITSLLQTSGAIVKIGENSITVGRGSAPLVPFDITTREYPGFPTDLQAPMVTYLTQALGTSQVTETIFEGRFKYVSELTKLGAQIKSISSQQIGVNGPTSLVGSTDPAHPTLLQAHDIRAGFAVVLAALIGKGHFRISGVNFIDRGYENLEAKLQGIGIKINRISK